MMDFWASNWGDVATAVGVIISLIGLGWAIKEASGARSASEAAQRAASETRDQIARHLQTVDLERAIGLIQLIKTLHDNDQWEAAREHYQTLRGMLTGIIVRCPEQQTELREKLATARTEVRLIEDFVRRNIITGIEESDRSRLNQTLNSVQSDLEELASAMGLGDATEEAKWPI